MLGKLRTACLDNYVLVALDVHLMSRFVLHFIAITTDIFVTRQPKRLVYCPYMEHNYKDTQRTVHLRKQDGIRLTSANAPSAGLAGTRGGSPPPTGGDRPTLSRQRVLRPKRSRAGQVRDATQRREGRARGGGGGRVLWTFPAGLLRDKGPVQSGGSARSSASQTRTEGSAQAHRRSSQDLGSSGARVRADAGWRTLGGALSGALRYPCASAQHPSPATSLPEAAGKKTAINIEAGLPDVAPYTAHYELLRSQVMGARQGDAPRPEMAAQPRAVGLALILREGMPRWLNAIDAVIRTSLTEPTMGTGHPSAPERPAARSLTSPWLSGVQRHDVTTLLTSLVLSTHRAERSSQKEGYRCQ